MTAPETRWTAETEELVASRGAGSFAARDILEALADAGLLLPSGGVTREQWRFEDIFDDDGLVVSSKYFAEPPPEVKAQWPEKSLRRRTVYVGPWIEVPS